MAKKEAAPYLVTKVDMAGNVLGKSVVMYSIRNREALLRELGQLTNLAPSFVFKQGGKIVNKVPNPKCIPMNKDYMLSNGEKPKLPPDPELDYDVYFDSDKCKKCVATYFRDDITDFYYYVEDLEHCRDNPRFQSGEFFLVGKIPASFKFK